VLRQNIYFCPSCEQYLQSTEFQLSSNSRVVGNCRNCNKIDNDARVRQDYSHYRFMLRQLRREEEAYGDDSKIAFLMQVRIVHVCLPVAIKTRSFFIIAHAIAV